MDVQKYSSSQVAKAAGMSLDNFRAQFTREHWRLFGNERPANGHAHQFTLGQAMTYALARVLSQCGFSASDAFNVAVSGFLEIDDDRRKAGELYPVECGRTFFVGRPAFKSGGCLPEDELDTLNFTGSTVVIDLSELYDRVCAALTAVTHPARAC